MDRTRDAFWSIPASELLGFWFIGLKEPYQHRKGAAVSPADFRK
jgi:hypothetical protein